MFTWNYNCLLRIIIINYLKSYLILSQGATYVVCLEQE